MVVEFLEFILSIPLNLSINFIGLRLVMRSKNAFEVKIMMQENYKIHPTGFSVCEPHEPVRKAYG